MHGLLQPDTPATLPPIRIEHDAEGVQLAVRELFEESFVQEALKSILEKIDGQDDASEQEREHILADMPQRTLSPGYYDRAAYLLELGGAIEAGVHYNASALMHADVLGLQAVRRAKSEYERDHPSCSACGTRQDNRFMKQCKRCRVKFAGRGD